MRVPGWIVFRVVAFVIALPLLGLGSAGAVLAWFANSPAGNSLREGLEKTGRAETFETLLAQPAVALGFLAASLVAFWWALHAPRAPKDGPAREEAQSGGAPREGRLVKKTVKQAKSLAKKGQPLDAAELMMAIEEHDVAAGFFVEAGEFVRAAEIRHDQNRFLEAAELYIEAGDLNSAGAIFAQQEEWAKAADCYYKIDQKSVAAEMFERAEEWRRAGDCYRDVEFLKQAAQSYVKCKAWLVAAECLEELYREESLRTGAGQDPAKAAELKKLVKQAAKLRMRSEEPEKALEMLELGGCHAEAASLAQKLGEHAKAAQLLMQAGDPQAAAEALRSLGEDKEAARVLGEYWRDQSDVTQAAEYFEQAEEWMDAADMYRRAELHEQAALCYERIGDLMAAAEMYSTGGLREKAADCFEHAGRFKEAAECCALAGLPEREADLLEKAGDFLHAGEAYHREGMDDKAISALQQLTPGSEGFATAAALLGEIFRSRGQLSLAIKMLKQTLGDAEVDRENCEIYYTLATVHQDNRDPKAAVEILDKILAIDYHFKDVETRLAQLRGAADAPGPVATGNISNSKITSQSGRYDIVGELGRGGMGIVYKAKDTVLDRTVALKVLPESFHENEQAVKNFLREAQAAAKLNHPNIVTVYDTGEQDGRYYIAMEYVDGTTIKEILKRKGRVAPAGILHVLIQICEALSYAHGQKVIHRDIKSANTMWARDKKAKLMDFGLAKVVEEVRNHTTVVSGTPYYMSPEQTLGKNVDHRTDIYSLGVTVFEMATGTVPFKEGNIPYHHVHTEPPAVQSLCPELPAPMAAIVDRCLLKDPQARFQSAAEILDALRASIHEIRGST